MLEQARREVNPQDPCARCSFRKRKREIASAAADVDRGLNKLRVHRIHGDGPRGHVETTGHEPVHQVVPACYRVEHCFDVRRLVIANADRGPTPDPSRHWQIPWGAGWVWTHRANGDRRRSVVPNNNKFRQSFERAPCGGMGHRRQVSYSLSNILRRTLPGTFNRFGVPHRVYGMFSLGV